MVTTVCIQCIHAGHQPTGFVREEVTSTRGLIEPACSRFDWLVMVGGWRRAWRWRASFIDLLVIGSTTYPCVITPTNPRHTLCTCTLQHIIQSSSGRSLSLTIPVTVVILHSTLARLLKRCGQWTRWFWSIEKLVVVISRATDIVSSAGLSPREARVVPLTAVVDW